MKVTTRLNLVPRLGMIWDMPSCRGHNQFYFYTYSSPLHWANTCDQHPPWNVRNIPIHTHTISLPECYTKIPVYTVTDTPYRKTFQIEAVIDSNHMTYVYFTSISSARSKSTWPSSWKDRQVGKIHFFFFAVITKAAVVLPKYYVTSQLTILQPKQSYVCSASFGVDQTTPVRSHTNPLHTLISFLIYNHFNIISSYNYV